MRNKTFEDIDKDKVNYSPDKKFLVTWYIEQGRDDKFEEKSDYVAEVWEVENKTLVQVITRRYNYDYQFQTESGMWISKAEFSDDGKFILLNGKDTDDCKVPFNPKK